MIVAPPLPGEQERLADLRALKILDTPPEERFDRIVKLASDVFEAPIAYIALVDAERQWFKAKCGVDANETSRRISFCSHTVSQNEPLIIPDAAADERFHDNPLVVDDPHIRFYAGHPLAGRFLATSERHLLVGEGALPFNGDIEQRQAMGVEPR